MTNPPASPLFGPQARLRLRTVLRTAREAIPDLSGSEAGRRAGINQSRLSKIERGALLPHPEDIDALARVYGLSEETRAELHDLAENLKREQSRKVILARGVAGNQKRIGELEKGCSLIRSFQPTMVIGLCQTAAYMRFVFGIKNSPTLDGVESDRAVKERKARQARLEDESIQFVLVMTEGALRWQVGSPALMIEQIQLISHIAERPNVRVGIIPWTQPTEFFPLHGWHIYDEDAVIVGTATATATMNADPDILRYVDLMKTVESVAAFGSEAQEHLARIRDDYARLTTTRSVPPVL